MCGQLSLFYHIKKLFGSSFAGLFKKFLVNPIYVWDCSIYMYWIWIDLDTYDEHINVAVWQIIDWLFILLYVPPRIFHSYGDVTITGEGLQNLGLCWTLRAFEQGWIFFRATPAVTRDLGFSGLIRMTASFSRLLRHARGCWGPILTRIPTGTNAI